MSLLLALATGAVSMETCVITFLAGGAAAVCWVPPVAAAEELGGGAFLPITGDEGKPGREQEAKTVERLSSEWQLLECCIESIKNRDSTLVIEVHTVGFQPIGHLTSELYCKD